MAPRPRGGRGLGEPAETLYEWRLHPGGVFSRARADQLFYSAVARAFAEERRSTGSDSVALLEACGGPDAFSAGYPFARRASRSTSARSTRAKGRRGRRARILARALADPRSRAPTRSPGGSSRGRSRSRLGRAAAAHARRAGRGPPPSWGHERARVRILLCGRSRSLRRVASRPTSSNSPTISPQRGHEVDVLGRPGPLPPPHRVVSAPDPKGYDVIHHHAGTLAQGTCRGTACTRADLPFPVAAKMETYVRMGRLRTLLNPANCRARSEEHASIRRGRHPIAVSRGSGGRSHPDPPARFRPDHVVPNGAYFDPPHEGRAAWRARHGIGRLHLGAPHHREKRLREGVRSYRACLEGHGPPPAGRDLGHGRREHSEPGCGRIL